MKIGIFDSGIGGLSVLHEALKVLPGESYLYYADTDHVPYGNKPKKEVRGYVFEAVRFLIEQGAQAILVACNTATSVAIDDLRATFELPIIGMEPAVKPAVAAHRDKRVLVFATEMTLREEKFRTLVSKLDNDGVVDYLSMQELVMFAERFEFEDERVLPYLCSRLAAVEPASYGRVVLGCTHFLYFKPAIRHIFPEGTILLDGNVGTVQHLKNRTAHLDCEASGQGSMSFFTSGRRADAGRFHRYLDLLDRIEAAKP